MLAEAACLARPLLILPTHIHHAIGPRADGHKEGIVMLYWSLMFLVIALVAGVLGFGGIAGTAASIAQVLFTLFLIVFLVSLVMGVVSRGRPRI